ncbi:MAG: methylmalonyl-CoA mutase small subunit [Bacteroidaceae bacterium]|nr:methylmalonyl-CoA mutase small subunit [Bacteroidaceae bacterium]
MANSKERLFAEFAPTTTEEWMEKITVDLKGADFAKKLVWRTNEGFNVQPFYRLEDIEGLATTKALPGEFPYVRGTKKNNNVWYVRQNIEVTCPKEANEKALYILDRGVDSLGFHFKGKDLTPEFIETLLDGIVCTAVELNFKTCGKRVVDLAEILKAYFTKKGYDLNEVKGSINFDPLNKIISKGKEVGDFTPTLKALVEACEEMPGFRPVAVNAVSLCNAGSYIYQELGYALAWGNEYLQLMTEAGVPVDKAAKAIKFNFGISGNYFFEIAKFRAARMLWAQIVKQYEPKCDCACKMVAHAETSTFNMTVFDAHVNLLRSQTEAMSAAIAGVDSITVCPFDKTYETPDAFSERLARNQQLLLKEESHMDKIVDPSAGSYYIETLTNNLAREGWKLFLAVEEDGGFLAQAKEGKVQQTINASGKARHEAVSKRKEILLGTNQYPNFNELANGKEPVSACCACGCSGDAPAYEKLDFHRAASDFEALRLQTEKSGKRPKAFMLTIGNLAMRQARAQFSCNFLACAGYQVIDNLGFKSVEEGVDAALKAGADIVVICSSDDEYAEYAIPAYKYLDGRAMFIVAGAPACMDDLKAAGIEHFIHVRCNVLDTLKNFNAILNIK